MYQKNPILQEGIVDLIKRVKKSPVKKEVITKVTPKKIVSASIKKTYGGFRPSYQSRSITPFPAY